jgi:regulator of protease activity HflC (stomatin/prohibitin superfamily)
MWDIVLWLVQQTGYVGLVVVVLAIVILPAAVRILPAWERAIILRLGKFNRVTGPGPIILIPYVDRAIRVDTRILTMDVPRQEMMTRDNVPVTVDAIVLFKVVEPQFAVLNIENYVRTTSLIAQTTLRSTIGQIELDDLLAQRDQVNQRLQTVIDEQTEPFGVKVTAVEVRDVSLPDTMKRAMAAQAESERERRAKVINALGEFEAAEKLTQAAALIGREPAALQLRFLQSVREIASERATMTILPVPLDIVGPFIEMMRRKREGEAPTEPRSASPSA